MKPIDEKLRYIRQKITNVKEFNLLGQDTESKYRFEVKGVGSFEYTPSVVFLFNEEFVAHADSKKLAKFVNKAISQALEVLRDPPSRKYNLQGWIKVDTKGVIFIPWVIPATRMPE